LRPVEAKAAAQALIVSHAVFFGAGREAVEAMASTIRKAGLRTTPGIVTLAIDVGGTGLKASTLDATGRMTAERVRVATPHPCRPTDLVQALASLVAPLPSFARISIGFPGVIQDGRVITAPHFDQESWCGYPLAEEISRRLGKPTRLLNDAEVQGLGIIVGRGLEVVLTLGTGIGSAVFKDGRLMPHLELAHHPIRGDQSYNEYLGNAARRALSRKKWNHRLRKMIEIVQSLLHYDTLYLGGGNATKITGDLPENVSIASNDAGITGGIRLWDEAVWSAIEGRGERRHGGEVSGRSARAAAQA
jgi:polyphosphate glucokinase